MAFRNGRLAAAAASVPILAISTGVTSAGTSTWVGTTDANWSTSTNWTGANTPPVSGDDVAFDGTSPNSTPNNDVVGLSLSGINFLAGAGAYTLNGSNGVALTGAVVNSSSNVQTIGMPLSFGAAQAFTGGSAPASALVINGSVTNTNTTNSTTGGIIPLTLGGHGRITNSFVSSAGSAMFITTAAGANWTIENNATNTANTVALASFNPDNGATVNFGTATSAPSLTITSNAFATGNAGDHTVGTNGTGSTLNVVNGFLNLRTRMNTRNGDINVSGGQLQVWNQFQMANSGPTETSVVTVSGTGFLDVRNSTGSNSTGGTLFVASRGTGTLNVTGGQVRAGTLDLSRGASATTAGSNGVVNLDGGVLQVNLVSSATANIQNNAAGSTATFNFNGGTLRARSAQGSFLRSNSTTGAQAPVTYAIKAGGAIIDSNGVNIGAVEPLQHSASLGATPDGGLTKLGTGTLTLSAVNTYTGPTVVRGGTLALASAASNNTIASSPRIVVGETAAESASVFDVTGITAPGGFQLGSGQTLGGFGKVLGAVTVAGTLAPGGSIGTTTVDGAGATGTALTLASGALLSFELDNALQSDQLALISGAAGDIAFNNNTINFIDLANGALADGQYTLVTADVAGAYSGLTVDGNGTVTGGLVIGSGLGGYDASIQQVGNNLVLNVAAVPEPTALAAVGIVAALGLTRRRRSR